MMQPVELPSPTLRSFAVPFWTALHPLSNAAPYWATGHSTELRCTLLSYVASTKLCCALLKCTLLSYTTPPYELAHPNWATTNPTELCSTQLSYAPMFSTELRSTFVQFCQCRNAGLSGIGKSVHKSGTGMLRYWTEMMDRNIDAGGIGLDANAHAGVIGSPILLVQGASVGQYIGSRMSSPSANRQCWPNHSAPKIFQLCVLVFFVLGPPCAWYIGVRLVLADYK